MGKKYHAQVRRAERMHASEERPPRPKGKFGHDYSKDYQDPSWPYARGKMDKGAWIILILTPTVIFAAIGYYWHQDRMREMVRTPLDAPKMIGNTATSALEDPDRFWGSYRSGLYFGLKTRSPRSPVVGLMWMTQFTGERSPAIRHWCVFNLVLFSYCYNFNCSNLDPAIQQSYAHFCVLP